jgi:cytidylate kinase
MQAMERLIPSVERRLSAWVNVQDRLSHQRKGAHLTITLSRQFGCEAFPLAERLQELMQARTGEPWALVDKALIERVSKETQLSERLLGRLGDESQALDFLASIIPGWTTHDEAYEILARYVVRIAREGNAIIVGRGGAVLTQTMPNCFHFRLEAPHEHRVASIARRLGVDTAEADALVREHQQRRDRFIERFLHCSMADTRYYHAVFNTAKSPLERIAAAIVDLVPEKVEVSEKRA